MPGGAGPGGGCRPGRQPWAAAVPSGFSAVMHHRVRGWRAAAAARSRASSPSTRPNPPASPGVSDWPGRVAQGTVMVTSAARLGPASAPGRAAGAGAARAGRRDRSAGSGAIRAARRPGSLGRPPAVVRRPALAGHGGRAWPAVAGRAGGGRGRGCRVPAGGRGRPGRAAPAGCRGSRRRAGPGPAARCAARTRAPHRRAVPGRPSRRSRTPPGTGARARPAGRPPSACGPPRGPASGPACARRAAAPRTSAPGAPRPAPHRPWRRPRRSGSGLVLDDPQVHRVDLPGVPARRRWRGSRRGDGGGVVHLHGGGPGVRCSSQASSSAANSSAAGDPACRAANSATAASASRRPGIPCRRPRR